MIDIADRPEIQAQIEEAAREQQAPQTVRAPVGNGHEAALKQGGTR